MLWMLHEALVGGGGSWVVLWAVLLGVWGVPVCILWSEVVLLGVPWYLWVP